MSEFTISFVQCWNWADYTDCRDNRTACEWQNMICTYSVSVTSSVTIELICSYDSRPRQHACAFPRGYAEALASWFQSVDAHQLFRRHPRSDWYRGRSVHSCWSLYGRHSGCVFLDSFPLGVCNWRWVSPRKSPSFVSNDSKSQALSLLLPLCESIMCL